MMESHEEALADPEEYGVTMPSVEEIIAAYRRQGKEAPAHYRPQPGPPAHPASDGPASDRMPAELEKQVYQLLYPVPPFDADIARIEAALDQLGRLADANPEHDFTIRYMCESLVMLRDAVALTTERNAGES